MKIDNKKRKDSPIIYEVCCCERCLPVEVVDGNSRMEKIGRLLFSGCLMRLEWNFAHFSLRGDSTCFDKLLIIIKTAPIINTCEFLFFVVVLLTLDFLLATPSYFFYVSAFSVESKFWKIMLFWIGLSSYIRNYRLLKMLVLKVTQVNFLWNLNKKLELMKSLQSMHLMHTLQMIFDIFALCKYLMQVFVYNVLKNTVTYQSNYVLL